MIADRVALGHSALHHLAVAPDPAHAAAAHRVVTTPELASFAGLLLDLDVNGGPDAVDWSWIATADVAEVATSPRSARNERWCPARKD